MKSSLPALLLSHGAALLAGCAAFAAWGKFHPRAADPDPTTFPHAQHRPLTAEEARTAAVDQVLASLPGPEDQQAAEASRMTAFQQQVRHDITRMRAAPENLQDELSKAMEAAKKDAAEQNWQSGQGSPRVAALLYFWGLSDLQQMLAGQALPWEQAPSTKAALKAALVELYPLLGRDAMLANMREYDSGLVLKLVVTDLLQSSDLAVINGLKGQVSESNWTQLLMGLREDWPFSRRDDLLKLLILQDRSEILLNGDSRGPEWNAWVAGLTTDPAVPESFRDHLIAQFSSPSDSLYHPGVPLDLQLKNPSATIQKIAGASVRKIIDGQDGEDLDYHFRTGQLDAAAVLARVEKQAPELAARDPQAMRAAVFSQLAAVNFSQAVSLLGSLPEPQRRNLIDSAALEAYTAGPQDLLEKLNYVPPRTQDEIDRQRDLWERSTDSFQASMADYPAWVQALPPGPNREFALYGLAAKTTDAALAARLRDLITDPALKKKAALHAP